VGLPGLFTPVHPAPAGGDAGSVVPEGHLLQLGGDFALLLHERRPESSQDYRRHSQLLRWSWRRGSRWLSLLLRQDTTDLQQRNFHTDNDQLEADRQGDAWRLGGGFRRGQWQTQVSVGHSRDWEASMSLGRRGWPADWQISAGVDRPFWVADQSFQGNRYRFPFPYRRERLTLRIAPHATMWPHLRLIREVAKGEPDRGSGDWNQFFARRHRGELVWRALPSDALFLVSWEQGYCELQMYADEQVYLRLGETDFQALRAVVVSPTGPLNLRLVVGLEERTINASSGWLEPWPFSFWDVFQNTRYRLDELDCRLGGLTLGLSRTFGQATVSEGGPCTSPGRQVPPPATVRAPGHRFDVTLSHTWLAGSGDFRWEERIPIIWPFLFTWEPQHRSLALPATRLLRLDLAARWSLSRTWGLRTEVSQHLVLPGGADDVEPSGQPPAPPSPEAEGDTHVFGGFRGALAVEWFFP
jgi:hypothetical protein